MSDQARGARLCPGKGRPGKWLLQYTLMFAAVALTILACYRAMGKSFVGGNDGWLQYYTAAAYMGSAFRSLLAGEGLKLIDFSLGQGMDVMGTLAYYGVFDPVNLPLLAASGVGVEIAYAAGIFLRLYLAGAFFGLYLGRVGVSGGEARAMAALAYVFSGYQFASAFQHPMFANGPMYLPLMLMCVEDVFARRRCLPFALVTAVMIAANYYFAFVVTLLTVLYILIRLAFRIRKVGVARSAADGFLLLGNYLMGLGISAVILLPAAAAYLGNARIGASSDAVSSLLRYPLSYYLNMLLRFCAVDPGAGYWAYTGLVPPLAAGALAVFVFARRPGAAQIRLGLLLCCAMLCVPLAGKVMNGMGYVTNRWCFALPFAAALAMAWSLPDMLDRSNPRGRGVIALTALYALGLTASALWMRDWRTLPAPALLLALAAGLTAYRRIPRLSEKAAHRGMALLVTFCCALYALLNCLPGNASLTQNSVDANIPQAVRAEAAAAAPAAEEGFFRVETSNTSDAHASVLGYFGVGHYWSVIPSVIGEHLRDLEVSGMPMGFVLTDLGSDPILDALACVKYAVRGDGDDTVIPDGFAISGGSFADGKSASVYENKDALPMGILFGEAMDSSAWQALNPADKRMALLTRAVTEEATGLPRTALPESGQIPYAISDAQGVEISGHILTATAGGRVELAFEAPADAELYLVAEGIELRESAGSHFRIVTFQTDAGENRANITNRNSVFSYDQRGVAVYLGNSGAGMSRLVASFDADARYAIDSVSLYAIPAAAIREAVTQRSQGAMWDATVSANRVSGSVRAEADSVLQFSIPYSAGWTCRIDGEDAPLFRCGGMYMGASVSAGEHTVALRYVTPGLKTGAAISGGALLLAAALALAGRLRRRALPR